MPSAQKIFTDDLVVKGEEIGLVERAPNSSDDEDEDDEDIDDIIDDNAGGDKLAPGSARVHWSTQEAPTTEYISELRLADRVFLLGDIVSRTDAQLGQTGIVTGMRMFCDVRCADGLVLRRVATELLRPLAACRPGALVLHSQVRRGALGPASPRGERSAMREGRGEGGGGGAARRRSRPKDMLGREGPQRAGSRPAPFQRPPPPAPRRRGGWAAWTRCTTTCSSRGKTAPAVR